MAKHKVVINACIGEFGLSGKKLPSLEWDYLFGGVLAPNGRIYGMPFDSRPVLEINVGAPSDWANSSRDFLLHGSLNKL